MGAAARGGARQLLAEQRDRAAIGPHLAGDQVEERGLAGAVGADDEAAFAGLDAQADRAGDAQAAEGFVEIADDQRAHGASAFCEGPPAAGAAGGRSALSAQRARRTEPGTSPSGMNTTMATKIAPSSMFQRSI